MKKIKFSVYAKSVRGGMFGIYIRCQQGVRIVPIDTGVRVFSDEWDEDNGLIVNNPNSLELNRTVRKCVYDLQNMEYSKSEEGISLSSLIKIWNEKDSYHDFYLFFENHISIFPLKE